MALQRSFVGRQFVMLWPDGHHDVVWPDVWCAVPYGAQEDLKAGDPEPLFRLKYGCTVVDRHMARQGF